MDVRADEMSDDFDELTSAYLDGQASPDEMARVESDPELRAEVASIQALAERLADEIPPVDGQVRAQHLSAGMAAFDDLFSSVSDTSSTDELSQRREARASRSGLPSWLSAAAVLLLVVGGIGWIASQSGSNDSETASVEADAADEDTAADSAAASRAASEELLDAESSAEATEESASDSAAESEVTQSASDEGSADSASAGEDDGESPAASPASTTTLSGGFFPDEKVAEARVDFDVVPDPGQLAVLAEGPLLDATLSRCGLAVEAPDATELIGFVPIVVAGAEQEVLVYSAGEGDEFATLLVDATCTVQS